MENELADLIRPCFPDGAICSEKADIYILLRIMTTLYCKLAEDDPERKRKRYALLPMPQLTGLAMVSMKDDALKYVLSGKWGAWSSHGVKAPPLVERMLSGLEGGVTKSLDFFKHNLLSLLILYVRHALTPSVTHSG